MDTDTLPLKVSQNVTISTFSYYRFIFGESCLKLFSIADLIFCIYLELFIKLKIYI